jgi:hypothetical protein
MKNDNDKAGMDLRTESQMLRDIEKLLIGIDDRLERIESKVDDSRWT